jgi:hypothetical protein
MVACFPRFAAADGRVDLVAVRLARLRRRAGGAGIATGGG